MSPLIEMRHLSRSFDGGKSFALQEVSLRIDAGEAVVLRGISGSGKSTLLQIVAGIDRPTSGEVLVAGEPFVRLPDRHLSAFRRHHIGMVFQQFNLIDHLSVEENVWAAIAPLNLSAAERTQRIEHALETARIAHKRQALAASLSGGEKQRTAIARALMNDPPLILCDEPTANLDRDNSLHFIAVLEQLHAEGKTLVVATHDPLFDALPFAHRTVTIREGRIDEPDSV
jgi:putative ABC transport system ATP-binding protein